MDASLEDTQKVEVLYGNYPKNLPCNLHKMQLEDLDERLTTVEKKQEAQAVDIKKLLHEVTSISATLKIQTGLLFLVASALLSRVL